MITLEEFNASQRERDERCKAERRVKAEASNARARASVLYSGPAPMPDTIWTQLANFIGYEPRYSAIRAGR